MAITGVPVIVVDEGGLPINPVEDRGPLMTVATNGIGAPITISELGAPAVVQGLTPTYTPEAIALFDEWDILGVPADDERKELVNDTIVRLIDSGIWANIDLLYFTAAHAENAAIINWKAPDEWPLSGNINAVTFTVDRGFTGNGTTSYRECDYIPNVNGVQYTLNDAGMWVWCTTSVTGADVDCGAGGGTVSAIQSRTAAGNLAGSLNRTGTALGGAVASSIGMSGVTRRSASDERIWRNGSQVASGVAASSGMPTDKLRICGRSPSSFGARQIAFLSVGGSCTGMEADFYNIVHDYMVAVGAA